MTGKILGKISRAEFGSLLDRVNEYAEQHNGCICFISKAQVLPKENIEETEKEASQ